MLQVCWRALTLKPTSLAVSTSPDGDWNRCVIHLCWITLTSALSDCTKVLIWNANLFYRKRVFYPFLMVLFHGLGLSLDSTKSYHRMLGTHDNSLALVHLPKHWRLARSSNLHSFIERYNTLLESRRSPCSKCQVWKHYNSWVHHKMLHFSITGRNTLRAVNVRNSFAIRANS